MELYQLRAFKMVAEEAHLTRAAQRLNTSQPAVSAQIKNLEDELGIALFRRTPKGMVLTDQGVELKKHAEEALNIVDKLASRAGQMQGTLTGALRIGLNSEPDSLRVSELFSSMKARHPNISIHLLQSMTGEVLNKLEDNSLDVGFMYGKNESDKIYCLELARKKLVIIGPLELETHLKNASPADLAHFPWIITPADCPFHTLTRAFFKQHNIQPSQVAMADQEAVIKTMVKAGVGLSLLFKDEVTTSQHRDVAIWDKEDMSLFLSIACLNRRKEEQMIKSVFSTLAGIWGA